MTSTKKATEVETRGSNADRYYTVDNILRGNEDSVIIGNFDRATQRPSPGFVEAKMKPGVYSIPNHSLVWAKRILDKNSQPTGELKFDEPWGNGSGYEAVQIRYIKSCKSLDFEFQKTKKIVIQDEQMFLDLSAELTNIDGKVDPMLKMFFEVCSLNKDSICRNPDAGIMFGEYDANKFVKTQMNEFDIEVQAMTYINEAKNDEESAFILGAIFGMDTKQQPMVIVGDLIVKMKSNPSLFVKTIDEIVNNMRKNMKFAYENGILGLDNPNVIQLKNGVGFDILFSDVPVSSAEEKIDWVLSQVLMSSSSYDGIIKIVEQVSAYQNQN